MISIVRPCTRALRHTMCQTMVLLGIDDGLCGIIAAEYHEKIAHHIGFLLL